MTVSTPLSQPQKAQPPRRKPLIFNDSAAVNKPCGNCGEIAGGKTAECAAICCCCPFAVLDLLILAVVKLPAGLCKKAVRKGRRRREKRRIKKLSAAAAAAGGEAGAGSRVGGGDVSGEEGERNDALLPKSPSAELREKKREEEMWAQFNGAGFWRSPSQKEIQAQSQALAHSHSHSQAQAHTN